MRGIPLNQHPRYPERDAYRQIVIVVGLSNIVGVRNAHRDTRELGSEQLETPVIVIRMDNVRP
jgi:hypothetical protein